MAPDTKRAVRPPLESVREAPFALVRNTNDDGEPNDGLTLDGYGAVFNNLTTIDSWEGRFREQIAPGSMKRSFRETPPKIQFDHGRHPMIGSIPIAQLRSISEDTDPVLAPEGGAHVVGRVFDNWLMQPVRDAIAAGAIDGMSFRFSVVPGRESWAYADGSPIRDESALMTELGRCIYGDVPDEELPIRTLKELKVPEIGPVTWPAYETTSVGMRSKVIDLGRLSDPAQRKLLAEAVFAADRAESEPDLQRQDSDDPMALVASLDAILDQASELIADTDMTTLPPEVAQACALIIAAETSSDALCGAMGVYDPDEESDEADAGRSKNVDTQQPTANPVGERLIQDAQQDAETAVERPSQSATRRSDPQQATPERVGMHPSKQEPRQRLSKTQIAEEMTRMRTVLLTIDKVKELT